MNLGIHQPQYLPWLAYFLKIDSSDVFIFLDSVDFQKNGLHNRNKIKIGMNAHFLTVPVKHKSGQKIIDVCINNDSNWNKKHWQTIQQNYSKAQSFREYEKDLQSIYLSEWQGLCELNIKIIKTMMNWMGITTPLLRSSQMESSGNGSDLILNLCKEVGATNYLSGVGGKNYLKTDDFNAEDVTIEFQSLVPPNIYPQLNSKDNFINGLSALDIIMNCGDEWKKFISLEA